MMKDGSEQFKPESAAASAANTADLVESLQIRLKHIQNDYALTRREYEAATIRYLDMLSEVNRQNRELELLKTQLEKRVQERTALLELSNQALRESESRLQMVLNATSDGVWDRNLITDDVYYSPSWAQMLGYEPEAIEPRLQAWERIIHPDDRPAALAALQAHLTGRTDQYSVEMRMRGKNGHWQWILSRGKVVERDAQGRPLRLVGTNIDITARKRAEDQMAQAAKMIALGNLVAGVAHEINNPNNFIMLGGPILEKYFTGMMAILDEKWRDQPDLVVDGVKYAQIREDIPRLLSGLMEGARRIRNIVRDLRDFARPDTSETNQKVDINQVLTSVVNLMRGVIRKSTNKFTVNYAETPPLVIGNAHKLEQVFLSLLKNAVESLTDKSQALEVSVKCDPARRLVKVCVHDEGGGIDPDIRGFIFDPFFTTKREIGGTGLGLTTSNSILQLHNAELTVDSAPGKGTTVTVVFSMIPG